jgi:hypothetical protein
MLLYYSRVIALFDVRVINLELLCTKPLCFLFALIAACDVSQAGQLGRLSFDDTESLTEPGSGSFAVDDALVFSVIQLAGASSFPLRSLVDNSSNPAVLSFSTFPDIVDGIVLFHGVAIGDGIADLEVSDHRNGGLLYRSNSGRCIAWGEDASQSSDAEGW